MPCFKISNIFIYAFLFIFKIQIKKLIICKAKVRYNIIISSLELKPSLLFVFNYYMVLYIRKILNPHQL